jgi:hypothetical protein
MKLNLPNSISSLQDLRALQLEIKEYARWSSHHDIKKRMGVKTVLEQPVLSLAAKEILTAWGAEKPLTSHGFDELADDLEILGKQAPSVVLTLAAPATGRLKMTLVEWCRKNIASDALVTFQFNTTLLGGMVVRYGSHIFDWSFRRQILDARGQFPEVLRHV